MEGVIPISRAKSYVPAGAKSNQLPDKVTLTKAPPVSAIADALNVKSLSIDWLAGDGSDRCYFRIQSPDTEGSLVLMQLTGADAEALKADRYDWIIVADELRNAGIQVPKLAATLPDYGALVIEDYGSVMFETTVLKLLEDERMDDIHELYNQAFGVLSKFWNLTPENQVWTKRAFDLEKLSWELRFFVAEYLDKVPNFAITPVERRQLQSDIINIATFAADLPQVFTHRDFHSRNIMHKANGLAYIDFQDARLGPPSYDLVSLVFDSYIPFDPETRMELLTSALTQLRQNHLELASCAEDSWKPVLLQRQLKALGSFGYLTLRKERGDYLKYVQPALKTLADADLYDDRWPFLSGVLLQRLLSSPRPRNP